MRTDTQIAAGIWSVEDAVRSLDTQAHVANRSVSLDLFHSLRSILTNQIVCHDQSGALSMHNSDKARISGQISEIKSYAAINVISFV